MLTNSKYLPDTFLSTGHIITHLIFTRTLWGNYYYCHYYSHFMNEETGTKRLSNLPKVTTDNTRCSWDSNLGSLASDFILLTIIEHWPWNLKISSRHRSCHWVEDPIIGITVTKRFCPQMIANDEGKPSGSTSEHQGLGIPTSLCGMLE